jgi:hypothetical protein
LSHHKFSNGIAMKMAGFWPIILNAGWGRQMAKLSPCPICVAAVPDVDKHVWLLHVIGYSCWCGQDISVLQDLTNFTFNAPQVFKRHCDENGGLLAHYLECQFSGVAD